ncbi:hypothetical protein NDU88_002467 [Pleurodeles waltl]|uniref:Uncharacterized protein n=1 Tax=Pleurodeles waltl TaxID=8319 RepID=A0AAV7VBD1_PLEWA|nr:hypothetical protein NDU88_002467 [Pleurodeles waltl]
MLGGAIWLIRAYEIRYVGPGTKCSEDRVVPPPLNQDRSRILKTTGGGHRSQGPGQKTDPKLGASNKANEQRTRCRARCSNHTHSTSVSDSLLLCFSRGNVTLTSFCQAQFVPGISIRSLIDATEVSIGSVGRSLQGWGPLVPGDPTRTRLNTIHRVHSGHGHLVV